MPGHVTVIITAVGGQLRLPLSALCAMSAANSPTCQVCNMRSGHFVILCGWKDSQNIQQTVQNVFWGSETVLSLVNDNPSSNTLSELFHANLKHYSNSVPQQVCWNSIIIVIDADHQNNCLSTNKGHFSSTLWVLIGILVKFHGQYFTNSSDKTLGIDFKH